MPKHEIPYWVDSTLPEHAYQLVIMESGDHSEELVELTRDEYITLKAHLAAMRGYKTITAAEAIKLFGETESLSDYYNCRDSQQAASHIETARDIYRALPELVLTVSEEFDAEIEELAQQP
jgi:hypothetical protein